MTRDGRTQDVKILGVSGNNIQISVGSGSVGVPLATISSVVMAAPPELAQALKAYETGAFAKALPLVKGIVAKYNGLPVDWARQAASLLGDIQVALGDLKEAEAAYTNFQRTYPGVGGAQTEVGMARIAVARKNYTDAQAKLEPIAAAALKEATPAPALAPVYSQAFFLLGQIAEAQGQSAVALESYLRTVTVFYHDTKSAEAAQQRADALRKKDPTLYLP